MGVPQFGDFFDAPDGSEDRKRRRDYDGNAPPGPTYDFDPEGEVGPWNDDPEWRGYGETKK